MGLSIFFTDIKINLSIFYDPGFSTGLVSTPTIVYLAEIALPQHRIIITTCSNLTLAMGITIIYLLGFLIPVSEQK